MTKDDSKKKSSSIGSKLGSFFSKKKPIDISLKVDSNTPNARKAFRIEVDNMHIILRDPRIKCKICDISASGLGFKTSKNIKVDQDLEAVILWSGKPVLKNIKLCVARSHKGLVGCRFVNLDRADDKTISKIVVAAQKRAIKTPQSAKQNKKELDKEVLKEAATQSQKHTKNSSNKKIEL